MLPTAKVTSIEAVAEFKVALGLFVEDSKEALSANAMEIQRAFSWLQGQALFWQREVRSRREEVIVAKNNLARRQMIKYFGRSPDCTEQEQALALAQRRLRQAEEKVENTRRWGPLLGRAVDEYEGPARQLAGLLEVDLARAIALLGQKIASLEAYVQLAPPPTAPLSPPAQGELEPTPSSAANPQTPAAPEVPAPVTEAPAVAVVPAPQESPQPTPTEDR